MPRRLSSREQRDRNREEPHGSKSGRRHTPAARHRRPRRTTAAIGLGGTTARAAGKRLAYLTPGLDLPFWRILAKEIDDEAKKNGSSSTSYDSHNSAQTQIQNAQDAIARRVDGIIISPTDSSTAPDVLAPLSAPTFPLSSPISAPPAARPSRSSSRTISRALMGSARCLAKAMQAKGWGSGTVGLVTISLARNNGQARTKGFTKAMDEAHIKRGGAVADADLHGGRDVQVRAGHGHRASRYARPVRSRPTSRHSVRSARCMAARKEKDILVAAFDGIPDFVKLIAEAPSSAPVCSSPT